MNPSRQRVLDTRLTATIVFGLTVLGPTARVLRADEPTTQTAGLIGDAAVQSALAEAAATRDVEAFEAAARRVWVLADRDAERFVGQLLVFSATDTSRRAVASRVLATARLQKETLVSAVAPQLDNGDANIRAHASAWLSECEDMSAARPPDFSSHRAIIEDAVRAGREPQASLVRRMYALDPGEALRTMVRAMQLRKPEEIRPILWAEHVVADLMWRRRYGIVGPKDTDAAVRAEIDKASRHDLWWVRLYAARIVHDSPELAGPEVVARLAADRHPLVREAAPPATPIAPIGSKVGQ